MPASGSTAYLDSSALVKLVVEERESAALRAHLEGFPGRASCGLARVEVLRTVRPHGRAAIARARRVLGGVDLLVLDEDLLESAALLEPETLRSLDAIHLAAALRLGDELAEVITYDRRMIEAAEVVGIAVEHPG